VTVVCVLRSGSHFTEEWVYALRDGVLRHNPGVGFVCLSDCDLVGVNQIQLATDLPGWWAKMEMFRPGLFIDERILYLDLDSVVVGDLSELGGPAMGRTLVLSDFYDPTNMASGVLSWFGGAMHHIWIDFQHDPGAVVRTHHRRMDHYLRRFLHNEARFQDQLPGQVVSYKADLRGRREPYRRIAIPEDARVVCMHGRPTLTDLDPDDPVRKEWKR